MTNNYGNSFHLACFSAGKPFQWKKSRCPRITTEWTEIYAFRNTLKFHEFSSNIFCMQAPRQGISRVLSHISEDFKIKNIVRDETVDFPAVTREIVEAK